MTGTDVITNRARVILADQYPDGNAAQRWTDAVLMRWLDDGAQLITTLRPESLLTAAYTLATFRTLTTIASVVGWDTTGLDNRYLEPLVDYVCGRALSQEAQDERDLVRARTHFQQFAIKAGLPLKGQAMVEVVAGRRL